jgi:hypothetical protein
MTSSDEERGGREQRREESAWRALDELDFAEFHHFEVVSIVQADAEQLPGPARLNQSMGFNPHRQVEDSSSRRALVFVRASHREFCVP